MFDEREIKARLKRALDNYIQVLERRKRTKKTMLDGTRRKEAETKFRKASKPSGLNDLNHHDSGVDMDFDEATNNDSQNADGMPKEVLEGCDEEAINDDDDESTVLPDYEDSIFSEPGDLAVHGGKETFPKLDCFLLSLPKELQREVLKYALKVDGSLSDHEFHFKCPSKACSQKPTCHYEATRVQYSEAREVLKTCSQIRNTGEQVFFSINEWTLHRPRLREGQGLNLKSLVEDTTKMFIRYIPCGLTKHEKCSRMPYVRYFRNFNMRIAISPTAMADLGVPIDIDPNEVAGFMRARTSQDREIVRRHTLTEAMQCEMFRTALSGFVNNQTGMFQNLRRLTLEVTLHSPVYPAASSPMDRCGSTFKVRILLDASTQREYATKPEPPSMSHNDMDNDLKHLEPKRRMLAPLTKLNGVRSVEVHRRWAIHYKVLKGSEELICNHALGQHARFDSVSQFLREAGPDFVNIQNTGLEHLKISTKNLLAIVENDTDDIEYDLVPPAESGKLLETSEVAHG